MVKNVAGCFDNADVVACGVGDVFAPGTEGSTAERVGVRALDVDQNEKLCECPQKSVSCHENAQVPRSQND